MAHTQTRTYTQEELDNDVPELEHIYQEHKKEQLKDIEIDPEELEEWYNEDYYD